MRTPLSVPRRWRGALLALLALLAFALYAESIPSGYVFDDQGALVENPVVNGAVPLLQAFTRDFWGTRPPVMGMYRPLVVASFAAGRRLSANPAAAHAANVLLHALIVLLFFASTRALLGESVAWVAAIFLTALAAPAEAVQSLVGRADLLLGLFALAGLRAHRSGRGAGLAALCLALGLLCKETAAVAPAAWLALDLLLPALAGGAASAPDSAPIASANRLPLLRRYVPHWRRYFLYAAVIAAYAAVRAAVFGAAFIPRATALDSPVGAAHGLGRLFGAGHVFAVRTLAGLADPFRRLYLCSAPACGPSGPNDPWAWLGLGVLAAMALGCFGLRRRAPGVAAGLAWFLVFFLPVSNVLVPSTTSYAERLLYVPCFGLAWAAAAAAEQLGERLPRRWLPRAALLAFLVPSAVALVQRDFAWRSADALYPTALELAPDSASVLVNAAYVAYRHQDAETAALDAQRALALWHPYPLASSVLASSLDRLGRAEEADAQFRAALEQGLSAPIVADYARFLVRHQRGPAAIELLEGALRREPLNVELRGLLAKVRAQQGPR